MNPMDTPSTPAASSQKLALSSDPLISIVVPAFNETENIPVLHERLQAVFENELFHRWELILVDDGSRDNSWNTICELCQRHDNVRGIRLSRNFGHQYALMAGLEHAAGDAVVTMDCDLQHPVEMLPQMIEAWKEGHQIVKMVRQDAPHTALLKKWTSRLYYGLFTWLSDVPMRSGLADFRLIDRQVLEELKRFQEEGLFLRGLIEWVGFRACELPYQAADRLKGTSQYSIHKMLKLAWHGISSFSILPLRIGMLFGIAGTVLSVLGILYALYGKWIQGEVVPGWASIVMGTSLLFSLLFVYLGILGEYIGRIVIEVRNRPRFIVMEKKGFPRHPNG